LAERIALTEIESNAHLYATLVERCLETLDLPAKGMVVVDLNPADKTRLEAAVPSALQGMRLNAVEDLKPGSVRVYANDAIIDDFIEQRLQAVARSVLSQPQAWQSHSIVLNSSNDSETPDVHP
jgi:flagellar biosynthesis/type III secretory pathway protein FliH